jgi:tetratricopeptide (TPR) repeat protein
MPIGRTAFNSPSNLQKIAAFVVAVIVLGVLFASALCGLVAPEHVNRIIRLCIAIAGAGFTLFLLGYFDWSLPNGIRVGGPIGVFIFLLLWDPGKSLPESFNKNFQACKDNVQSNQDDVAIAYCARAVDELPNSAEARYWLAAAQFHRGQYGDAVSSWKRALELGADVARTNYNIAFAYFRQKNLEEAVKAATAAADASDENPGLRARSQFMIANAEFSLWNFGAGSDSQFTSAMQAYQNFLIDGSPKYKAQAELACMLAVKAGLSTNPGEKANYEDLAVDYFAKALTEIKNYDAGDVEPEKSAFVEAYGPGASRCGAELAQLWERKKPNESYSAMLEAVRT